MPFPTLFLIRVCFFYPLYLQSEVYCSVLERGL